MSPGLSFFLAAICFHKIATAERPHDADSLLGREEHAEGVHVRATGIFQRTKDPLAKQSLLEASEGSAAASAHSGQEPAAQTSAQKHDKLCGDITVKEDCGKEGDESHKLCAWEDKPDKEGPSGCFKVCEFPPCYVVNASKDAEFHKDLAVKAEGEEYPANATDIYTKMRAGEEYKEKIKVKNADDSDLAGSQIAALGTHQFEELKVSGMYDTIRKRLNRQEKMLNIGKNDNGFSVAKFAESGKNALEDNEGYHKMLEKYVQGLYQMAAGANKLTHDTYIRHAGIATHLYDTVKDASDYYGKADTGIEATVNNEEGFDHMAHHKEALKAFKENAGASGGGGDASAAVDLESEEHIEKASEMEMNGTCLEYWAHKNGEKTGECRVPGWVKISSESTKNSSASKDLYCCGPPSSSNPAEGKKYDFGSKSFKDA